MPWKKILIVTVCVLALASMVYVADTANADIENSPPKVYYLSPEEDEEVSGTVIVEGWTNDNETTPEYVQVKIDGGVWRAVHTWGSVYENQINWQYEWDSTTVPNGNYTIKVRSYDGEDYSDVVSVTVEVSNNHPPTVDIVQPEDGATVNGTMVINGTASDVDSNATLQKVEIEIEDSPSRDFYKETTASGLTAWSYRWNTTEVEDGDYTIKVRAYDTQDYSDPHSITVTVDNKEEAGGGGTPGFQFVLLLAAAFITLAILRKRRCQ